MFEDKAEKMEFSSDLIWMKQLNLHDNCYIFLENEKIINSSIIGFGATEEEAWLSVDESLLE